ncbi:MAG: DUF3857 domain-containing protein [Acidobacteriota bacterium]
MKAWAGLLAAAALCFAEDAPEWARQAAAMKTPEYPARVGEVVLLNSETLTVSPDGRRTMRERKAVRIARRGGSVSAVRIYNERSGRIAEFRAWLLPPAGKAIAFGKDHIIDAALDLGNLYDEARQKIIQCPEGAEPGSVFAWEVVEEEKSVFTQGRWLFQLDEPVLVSRFVLSLPPGWEARGTVFNRDGVAPSVSGSQYTWELRDLPWIEPEEYSPEVTALVPWLGYSFFPSGEGSGRLEAVKDWAAVAALSAGFADPAAAVTDSVRVKASELARNAPGELEKIRAIAAFVQQTTYVAVATNVSRGGGYTPHPASLVLTRNYGDCKDKVALLRALLAAAGIESYDVSIYSGDRHAVRREWPALSQFNHAIAAIRVSPSVALPTVIEHPGVGRLLMFDPTSRTTPVGDLPEFEQGSLALVSTAAHGALIEMPRLPPAANRVETSAEAVMDRLGGVRGTIRRQYHGQSGGYWRKLLLDKGADELKRAFERTLARHLGGMSVEKCDAAEGATDRFDVAIDLAANPFGQIMQDRLLLVRPGQFGSISEYGFQARERKWPVELSASLRHDVVRVKLPAGYEPDEVPEAVRLDTPYGAYSASWTVAGGEVTFEQTLTVHETLAPAAEYAGVRAFFDKVAGAQASAVVMLRK